jgi:hypothetical protein
MKALYKVSILTLMLGGAILAGSLLNITADSASVGTQPGTADDPVVTKSYVDQQIQKALGGSTATPTTAPSATQAPGSGSSGSDAVVIVDVKPGQTLIASAGAEFIVRTGKAFIYSTDSNGVADLTDGKDLTNGQTVPTNHLLSYPRAGRGIAVQDGQTSGLVVMVRGGYVLQ